MSWHPPEGTYQNGHPNAQAIVRPGTAQEMEHLKNWSISTYKYTGNTFPKGLVKVQGLWILVLKGQIILLKEAQVKYMNVSKLAKQMPHHFHGMI